MSTALEAASLIMIPTSYSDGLLASVKPNDGAGDFTFSRGSNLSATRINADGYIEKGYENLLLQSNSFTTTPWVQVSILPPTSGQTGYDGSTDAWYFEKTGAFGRLQQSISTSGVETFSVYLKAKDSSWVNIETSGASTSRQYFDLTAPIETAKGLSNNIISSSIEDAGNGWRKCSITYEGPKTFLFIFIAEESGRINGTTGSLYIQDAMLNQGLVAYPYVETTTAPVAAGILEDMPRIDFSGGNQSLLLETSRTNLAPYSEYIEGLGGDVGLDFNYNDATSPEGLTNAVQVVSNNTGQSYFGYFNGTVPVGDNTFSVFAKYNNCQYICIRILGFTTGDDGYYWFDIQNGTKGSKSGSTITYDIEDYGNGWYRCYVIHNVDSGDISGAGRVYLCDSDNNLNSALNKAAYFYGLQWEAGSYPTSYIPTYGVSQTRLGDVANNAIANTSGNYWTLFIDYANFNNGDTSGDDSIVFKDSSNADIFKLWGLGGGFTIRSFSGNSNGRYYTSNQFGSEAKAIVRYDGTEIGLFLNGVKQTISSPSPLESNWNQLYKVDTLRASDNKYNFNQILVFPTALSDEECITLTTI